jgi:hypothetical protein
MESEELMGGGVRVRERDIRRIGKELPNSFY